MTRLAPVGSLGWLLVLVSCSASWWPPDVPAWPAVPLALLGTGLAAWQAGAPE